MQNADARHLPYRIADPCLSPAVIADVLVHKCYDWEKPTLFRKTSIEILGDGILFAEGDVHKQQRKNLGPAFGFRHIKELYPMFWERSLRLVKAMEVHGERSGIDSDNSIIVEVTSWATKATLSIIEEAAMGTDTHAIEDPKEPLGLTYRILMNPGMTSQILQMLRFWLPAWLISNIPDALNRAIKKNASLVRDICHVQTEHLESLEKATEALPNTIIANLVKSKQFSTPEIIEQMKTFLVAGHETTASALTWAVYLLTQHPDMQKR